MSARALMLPAALVACAAGQVPAPDDAAQEAMVSRIRGAALEYGDRLQNFTCTQITARSIGPSATGPRWKPLETQEMELNYVDHHEHYKLLKVNGETTDLQKRIKSGYLGIHFTHVTTIRGVQRRPQATTGWGRVSQGDNQLKPFLVTREGTISHPTLWLIPELLTPTRPTAHTPVAASLSNSYFPT